MVWAIARAEMRSTRRLTRYWVFSILSTLFSFLVCIYYSVIHGLFSYMTASIGPVGPRFLVAAMGMPVMVVFLLGLVFLAFDVRARDVRERMAEVLDSRPVSNLEFVLGRGFGLALMGIFPLFFLGFAVQVFGSLALVLDWPIGEPVEPMSLIGLLLSATAAFFMWSALIVFLAVSIGNRLIVAILGLAVLGLQMWGMTQIPVYLQAVVGFAAAFGPASDIVSAIGRPDASLQQLAFVLFGGGLFFIAAAIHPRLDDARGRSLAVGGGLCVAAVCVLGGLLFSAQSATEQRATWLDAHMAKSSVPRGDILKKSGKVVIDPGDNLSLDLEFEVRAPDGQALDSLLFTLNPGLEVSEIRVNGSDVAWSHDDGLLDIAHALSAGMQASVEFIAQGKPDTTFGHFDSAIDFFSNTTMDGQIALLGVDISIFDSRYVALPPAARWMPKAGADAPQGDSRTHPQDYFTLDLEVTIPQEWKLAGPGARQLIGDGTYRFVQDTPMPMVGLFAAEFASRQLHVAGVDFEVLMHPSHDRNLKFFADAGDEIELALDERMTDANRLGLEYPYGTLTLVEVPGSLRGYGGGWRMDSTQSLPGILTMKETGFPTSRFENQFRDPERFAGEEGGAARAKVNFATQFFANDVSGGNILHGRARNLFLFQTSAHGEGALAINFVIDEMVSRLLAGAGAGAGAGDADGNGGISYFSPYIFGQESGFIIGETVTNMVSGNADSVAQSIIDSTTNQPSVWDMALGTALADLDTKSDPKNALNVLALKSGAIALSIIQSVGEQRAAQFLVTLRDRHRGRNFTADDFSRAAKDAGIEIDEIIGDWLHDTALPGFVTSSISQTRLKDDERGNPVYQTRFHLRNDEPTPGLVVFNVKSSNYKDLKGGNRTPRIDKTQTYRVAGNESLEIGIVTDQPVYELTMNPYLALNRKAVNLNVPDVDTKQRVDAEPFLGAGASTWAPDQSDDIVVDDLDPGFSVTGTPPVVGGGGFISPPIDLDQGLPQFKLMFGVPAIWSRQENDTGWGKYRHTAALVGAGDGGEIAHFRTTMPKPGRWRLGYHLPNLSGRDFNQNAGNARVQGQFGPTLGTYEMTVLIDGDEEVIEFDGGAADTGWNTLGDFDLGTGEVEVRVTNVTSGSAVVADAIRWSPVGG